MIVDDLFGEAEQKRLEAAIAAAELNTSGEIRVHLEDHCKEDVMDHAAFIFKALEMHKTELRNGVLFYLAAVDKKFAVLGDSGINKVIDPNFWNSTKDLMIGHFKEDQLLEGLEAGIAEAGIQLKKHFPYQSNDVNELSNEISMGDLKNKKH